MRFTVSLFLFFTSFYLCSAVVYNFFPSNTTFATTLNTLPLVGGDIVNFRAATNGGAFTYDMRAFAGTYRWVGTQNNPIIVRAFPGDRITLTTSNPNSNIIQLSGSHWVFSGFEMIGNANARGSLALRLMGNTNHVVVENLRIRDLYQNAVVANSPGADYNNITIRGNEVSRTAETGECFYFGCQATNSTYSDCQIHDSVIENNFCHDTCLGGGKTACTGGSMGSGYQVKFGSYRNIIRNNVCFNTFSPCVLMYDDFGRGSNLVEGNVVLNTAGGHGIQASAGTVIRNNLVFNSSGNGIYISDNPNNLFNGLGCRNLVIESNTLVLNRNNGLKFQSTPTNTIVRNNAVLGNTPSDFWHSSQAGVTWSRNAFNTGNPPPNVNVNGTFLVGAIGTQLVNSGFNFYPIAGSSLINAGAQSPLGYDINNFRRSGCTPTVGAYEYSTPSNPGWTVSRNFKQIIGTVRSCSLTSPCPISCSPATSAPTTAPTTRPPTTAPTTRPPTTAPTTAPTTRPPTTAPTTAPTTRPPTTAPTTAPTTRPPTTAPTTGPRIINVSTTAQIINAIANSQAGDNIVIAPGTYSFTESRILITNRPPATLRAANNGTVFINFGASGSLVEGFYVDNSPGWVFENLVIEGVCATVSNCDGAYRIVGASDNVVIRNNYLINFNTQIRVNIAPVARNGQIIGCTFFDRVGRPASTYKVFIDGGNGWTIRGNSFRGYFSNAAGSMSGGVNVRNYNDVTIDSNLFVATKTQISFGIFLRIGTGNSNIFNNIISTTNSVGIYLETVNRANIYNNILYDTLGIDSRFAGSYAIIRNNVYNGNLRDRDSATPSVISNNLQVLSIAEFSTYFNNPAALDFTLRPAGVTALQNRGFAVPVTTDYCLRPRSGNHIGIFDLSTTPFGCPTAVPVNVANPNLRALTPTDTRNTQTTSNNSRRTTEGDVALYIILAVGGILVITLIIIVIFVVRNRRNQNLQNLEEPLLNK